MIQKHRVTQADIARALEVSPALVALVVGRSNSPLRHSVKKATAEKIRAKAAELGYRPNRAAQMTRSGRSNLIIHLSRGGYSDVASQISYHIGRLAHEAGFDLQTMDAFWWSGDGSEVIEHILAFQPEGVIVSGAAGVESDFEKLHRAGVPLVAPGLELPGLPLVGYDARGAVTRLTRHCLKNGREPVLVLREPSRRFWQIRARERGYHEALQEAGYDKPPQVDMLTQAWNASAPSVILDPGMGNLTHPFEDGMRVGRWLLAGRGLPDALVCSNDHYAIGIMTVLQRAGARIPEDVVITGFDNLDYATQGEVALTSVEQPVEVFCQTSFEMLMEKLGRRASRSCSDEKPNPLLYPCRIHWRESTRCDEEKTDWIEDCGESRSTTTPTHAAA